MVVRPGLEGVMVVISVSDAHYFPGFAFLDEKAGNKGWKK